MPAQKIISTSLSIPIYLLLLLFFLFFNGTASAQKNYLKGIVRDTTVKKNLQYSIAALINEADSALYIAVRADESGAFEINKIPPGKYTLMVSYPHMADYLQQIVITDTSKINLGKITMVSQAVLLQEVVIQSGLPIRMKGDTLEYTADSFAVKPGANVEELLKRLPGIHVDRNGKITAQGKEVKKILVDGDEFFNDDPGLVAKFLNADAVEKVQVFDKRSANTDFTGIDDGKRTKTINLKLKKNKKNGSFGKMSAASDGGDYYNHEAMAALFKASKKISVFGIASKTGKEGVSYSELTKYVGQDYELIDDGNNNSYTSNYEYENESYYGNGLPAIINGGVHYSNKWKEGKQKLFSNYRIKQIKAVGWSNGINSLLLPDGTGFFNEYNNRESSINFTQKASGNFTTSIDSFSTLKISLNGSISNGNSNTVTTSSSKNENFILVNNSYSIIKSLSNNKKLGSNISYQHRFKKEGRTLSLLAQQDYTEGDKDDYNFANNNYYNPSSGVFTKADTLDQLQNSHQLNKNFAAKISITEKLSKTLTLSAEYGWKQAVTQNKFKTFNNENGKHTGLADSLSNNYDFTVNTNIGGAILGWHRKKMNITAGSQVYFTGFKQADNDLQIERRRNFINAAPTANIQINLNESSNLGINYSGQTFQPEADQLQPLRRSSNPLYIQIGNPDLVPGFRHNVYLNYYLFNWLKGKNIQAYMSVSYVDNDIVTKTKTTAQGKTTAQYINLNGVPAMNGSIAYSLQFKKLHLRPSIRISFNRYGSNSILNDVIVKNKNNYGTVGFSLTYDLENKMSMAYSGSANFSNSKSNFGNTGNRQSMSHSHNISGSFYLPKKIELSSECVFNLQPRNSSFKSSINIILWNAYLQKKIFKNDKAFVKLSVNDILNNNTGYSRYIDGNNVTEGNRLVLKRYFLLTLGWNFSKSI